MKKNLCWLVIIFAFSALISCGADVGSGGSSYNSSPAVGGGGGGGGTTPPPPADSAKTFTTQELVAATTSSSGKFELKNRIQLNPIKAVLQPDGSYELTLVFTDLNGNANCVDIYIFSVSPLQKISYSHPNQWQVMFAQNPGAGYQVQEQLGKEQFANFQSCQMIGGALNVAQSDLGRVVMTTSVQNSFKFYADASLVRG